MASGKSGAKKTKSGGKAKAVTVEAAPTPQAALKGKAAPKPGRRTGRPRGSRNKPETPGRVVAIGLDVPKLDDVLTGHESAPEPVNGVGRPSDYRPEYAAIARAMCKCGAGDMELAREFDVDVSTIWYWRAKHEPFSQALTEGKDAWDDRIERSLAMRAAGFSVHTEKLFNYEGAVVRAQTVEFYPPETGAIKLWLGNRRPDKWKDKHEVKIDSSDAFLRMHQMISDGAFGK